MADVALCLDIGGETAVVKLNRGQDVSTLEIEIELPAKTQRKARTARPSA